MTFEDFNILKNTDLSEYIGHNPLELALKGVSRVVCTQIKYLEKAKSKLPEFYNAKCIIPELSFEQSSSKYTAATKCYEGNLCIDMSCGLGADTLNFSRFFKHVITIEKDELLSEIAEYNFYKLGCKNIDVVCNDSLKYISEYKGEKIDLLFVDPARRKDSKKVFLFEDCSPNVYDVVEIASKVAKRLVIKASPLYDIEQAKREFQEFGILTLETVSYNDECKELVIDIEFSEIKTVKIVNCIIEKDGAFEKINIDDKKCPVGIADFRNDYKYIYTADVSFYKSRTLEEYIQIYHEKAFLSEDGNYVFSMEKLDDFHGKCYQISFSMPYKPKLIKQYFKEKGIKSATIIKRGGGVNTSSTLKQLSLKEGNDVMFIIADNAIFVLGIEMPF